jgi:Holliday junction resolvase RusA-like endonuclease
MKKLQYHQMFSTRPKSKGRPRVTKTGHAFTPKETVEYEKKIAEAYKGPLFEEGMLSMKLRFTVEGTEMMIERVEPDPNFPLPKGKLTGDIDNYAKSILDALNGVAYTDDKQIVCLYLEKA